MADRFSSELTRLLDEYDSRRLAVESRERQVKADDARFLSAFADLRRNVIRPVFDSARDILAQRGHAATIIEQEFGADAQGKPVEASISISVVASGAQPPRHADDVTRSLTIATRHYNKTVSLQSPSNAVATGAKTTYGVSEIDRQLVEEQVLKFVSGIVAA
jgi:hypothetical protein